MPTEEKVIRYTLTHKDLFAFNLRGVLHSNLIRFIYGLMLLYLIYMGINTPSAPGRPELSLPIKIITVSILGVIAFAFMSGILLLCLVLLVFTKKFKGLIGQHELKLTDAGMITQSANSETIRKWTGLLKVKSTSNYLYLYVNETSAQIIPKRYFASPAEARAFEQRIREQMKVE